MENQFSFGAQPSPKDNRTIKNDTLTKITTPLQSGGYIYREGDIENQRNVGICTAISLIQNREWATGKKFSPDFQYLLQKKYYDFNWIEGSCILNALKVGKKYGFLPIDKWTWTTEADRNLSYTDYVAKLQKIPNTEIDRLISLCTDKIEGYAMIDVSDPQSIAKGIIDSRGGVLCRYDVGNEWWTPSWREKDLSPLRPPVKIISGHAVVESEFDFNINNKFIIPNTWGITWCRKGQADIIWDKYKPTEVWSITRSPIIQKFNEDLKFGMSGDAVVNLQNALKIKGFFSWNSTGYFGLITSLAVKKYQVSRGIINTGYCGHLTRGALNSDFNL